MNRAECTHHIHPIHPLTRVGSPADLWLLQTVMCEPLHPIAFGVFYCHPGLYQFLPHFICCSMMDVSEPAFPLFLWYHEWKKRLRQPKQTFSMSYIPSRKSTSLAKLPQTLRPFCCWIAPNHLSTVCTSLESLSWLAPPWWAFNG